jgi:transposase InsO family protein
LGIFTWKQKELELPEPKDVLDAYLFNSLDEASRITFEWLEDYNSIRPHASLGNKTPYEFSANLESVYL